jgi:hypothetical protein
MIRAEEAWFYENGASIDVYIQTFGLVNGEKTVACRIRRAHLEDWLKRTKK